VEVLHESGHGRLQVHLCQALPDSSIDTVIADSSEGFLARSRSVRESHLICQAEVEMLHEGGHGCHQAHLCQRLPHTAARALSEREVALGPLAIACKDQYAIGTAVHCKYPTAARAPYSQNDLQGPETLTGEGKLCVRENFLKAAPNSCAGHLQGRKDNSWRLLSPKNLQEAQNTHACPKWCVIAVQACIHYCYSHLRSKRLRRSNLYGRYTTGQRMAMCTGWAGNILLSSYS